MHLSKMDEPKRLELRREACTTWGSWWCGLLNVFSKTSRHVQTRMKTQAKRQQRNWSLSVQHTRLLERALKSSECSYVLGAQCRGRGDTEKK